MSKAKAFATDSSSSPCPCGCSNPDIDRDSKGRVKLSSDPVLSEKLDEYVSAHPTLAVAFGPDFTPEQFDFRDPVMAAKFDAAQLKVFREGCAQLRCVFVEDYDAVHKKKKDPNDPEEEYHERRRLFDEIYNEMEAKGELPDVHVAERDPATSDLHDELNDQFDIPDSIVNKKVDAIMAERKLKRQAEAETEK